jgi:hypothetical protein
MPATPDLIHHPPPAGKSTLIFGLLGAPLAWSLHLAVEYVLVALACSTSWERGLAATLAIATVVLAALSAIAGVFALRHWKRLRASEDAHDDAGARPQSFLMLAGVLLSVLFTLTIILTGLAPLFVPVCPP